MNIDALHSALVALIRVSERSAPIDETRRELNLARVTLARGLGFDLAARRESGVVEADCDAQSAIGGDEKQTMPRNFLGAQREKLLRLRELTAGTISETARATMYLRADRFGLSSGDPADAGSEACDYDFALVLLSQESDALREIDEALGRIERGTYGVCEMSGHPIPHERLEALPFARYTVECQAQIERERRTTRFRPRMTPLFDPAEEIEDADEPEATVAARKVVTMAQRIEEVENRDAPAAETRVQERGERRIAGKPSARLRLHTFKTGVEGV